MKNLRKDFRLKVHTIVLLLLLCYDSGVAQLCNPLMQDKTNTAELCTDSSTSGHTIFITSGAPKHSTVDSCICDFDINGVVRNITISYSAGNANDNCGVNIDIDDGSDAFTCTSDDLVVQTLKSLEFSRSTTKETNYCLEINLENQTNSTIFVTCAIELRDDSDATTHVTTKDDQTGHNTTPADVTSKVDEDKPSDSTQTSRTNESSAIIGGAVGGGVAVLLIFVVVIVICLRKRHRSKDGKHDQSLNDNKLNIEKRHKKLAVDNAAFEKTKTDVDLVVTYNDMYNMETVSDYEKTKALRDKEIQNENQRTNDYIVISDNVMYNVDTMHPRDEHYSVPSLTDPSTDSPVGDARVSQIYHEIESNSPVTTESNKEW